jgi:hypothetical protein
MHFERGGRLAEDRAYLRATREGLLLAAAAGLPLPMVRDEEGRLVDGEECVDTMLVRILADRAVG